MRRVAVLEEKKDHPQVGDLRGTFLAWARTALTYEYNNTFFTELIRFTSVTKKSLSLLRHIVSQQVHI